MGMLQGKAASRCSFTDLLHRRVLILGDVQTGKTSLTARLIREAVQLEGPGKITIIDMAPNRFVYRGRLIGGRTSETASLPTGVMVLQPGHVNAPRCLAENKSDLLRQVEENSVKIEQVLEQYLAHPTPVLFLNDISLYLQCGKWRKLWDVMKDSDTSVANAYYGRSLDDDLGTGVSSVERSLVRRLTQQVDLVIHL